jgi:hypothetical protein
MKGRRGGQQRFLIAIPFSVQPHAHSESESIFTGQLVLKTLMMKKPKSS